MARMHPDSSALPADVRRGRGAISNSASRFESATREGFDDGWEIDEEITPARREVLTESSLVMRHRTCRLIDPSIPIEAVSTAAYIVSRGPLMLISACHPGSILKRN